MLLHALMGNYHFSHTSGSGAGVFEKESGKRFSLELVKIDSNKGGKTVKVPVWGVVKGKKVYLRTEPGVGGDERPPSNTRWHWGDRKVWGADMSELPMPKITEHSRKTDSSDTSELSFTVAPGAEILEAADDAFENVADGAMTSWAKAICDFVEYANSEVDRKRKGARGSSIHVAVVFYAKCLVLSEPFHDEIGRLLDPLEGVTVVHAAMKKFTRSWAKMQEYSNENLPDKVIEEELAHLKVSKEDKAKSKAKKDKSEGADDDSCGSDFDGNSDESGGSDDDEDDDSFDPVLNLEHGGEAPWAWLKDVLRLSILCDTVERMVIAYNTLVATYPGLIVKNRVAQSTRDILVSLYCCVSACH